MSSAQCPQCLNHYTWETDRGHKTWCSHYTEMIAEGIELISIQPGDMLANPDDEPDDEPDDTPEAA